MGQFDVASSDLMQSPPQRIATDRMTLRHFQGGRR